MPSKPALKSHIRDFATPAKSKVRSGSTKHRAPGKENKLAGIPEKESFSSDDFATPRRSSVRPSIIVKEKLSSPLRLPTGVSAKNQGNGNHGVPTAHVFPSPAISSSCTSSSSAITSSHQHALDSRSPPWAEPALASTSHTRRSLGREALQSRRDAETSGVGAGNESFGGGGSQYSGMSMLQMPNSLSGSRTTLATSATNDSLFRPSISTITGRQSDSEFHTLLHDPDQTLDQTTRYMNRSGEADRDIFATEPTLRDMDSNKGNRMRNGHGVHRTSDPRELRENVDISGHSYAPSMPGSVYSSQPHDRYMGHNPGHPLAMTDPGLSGYLQNHRASPVPYEHYPTHHHPGHPHPGDIPYPVPPTQAPYPRPGSSLSHTAPGFQAASFGSNSYSSNSSVFGGGSMTAGGGYLQTGSGYAQTGNHPAMGGSGYEYDEVAAQWQLRHREKLRRQQLEAAQPVFRESSSSLSSLLTGDPHKLHPITRAAEDIIHEKDTVIERQRITIMELRRQLSRTEAAGQQVLLSKLQETGDAYNLQLQEKQYEAASLKAQVTEMLSTQETSLAQHEKLLAAREYEISELKERLEKEIQKKTREIEELEAKMKDKDTLLSEWKAKHAEVREKVTDLEGKNRQLERYLQDLPTGDELKQKNDELRTLKEDKLRYKQKAGKLEAKVRELQKGIESRDALVQDLGEKQDDLKVQVDTLKDQNSKLTSEVKRLREGGATIPEEDLEELRLDNRKLQQDLDKARRLLDGKHKKMQQAEASHQHDLVNLQDRLAQEENTVTALRDDLGNKEEHLSQLRNTMKLLSAENQELLDTKFKLQDKINEFERQHTGEAEKQERRLTKAMSCAFRDLQSIVQVCAQHAAGEDPNISSLLGVKASPSGCDFDPHEPIGDNIQALKYRVSKVQELQAEIDRLREMLADKYAEDMGQNLNCTQQ